MAREQRPPDSLFWVEPSAIEGDTLRLDPEESRHLLRVFRAVPGVPFEAVDGEGRTYRCTLLSAGREKRAVGRVLARRENAGELPAPLYLIAGLPDPAAAEELIARAVPLGVSSILLVATERSERWRPTAARLARLARLSRAALKQSRRSRLPRIQFPGTLGDALAAAPPAARYLADPEGIPWSQSASTGVQTGVALGVGPPGGFTADERARFEAASFTRISLGPSRLTTQDAVCVVLSLGRERILSRSRERD